MRIRTRRDAPSLATRTYHLYGRKKNAQEMVGRQIATRVAG